MLLFWLTSSIDKCRFFGSGFGIPLRFIFRISKFRDCSNRLRLRESKCKSVTGFQIPIFYPEATTTTNLEKRNGGVYQYPGIQILLAVLLTFLVPIPDSCKIRIICYKVATVGHQAPSHRKNPSKIADRTPHRTRRPGGQGHHHKQRIVLLAYLPLFIFSFLSVE